MLFRERQLMNSFKPGDWVYIPSLNTEPVQYCSDLCHLGLELWQPTVGEWCWFYREQVNLEYAGTHWAIPYLGRFGKFTEQGVQTIEKFCYSFCEPFIGQLPTSLKDQS